MRAVRTIAVLSDAYVESVKCRVEWQSAWVADPQGVALTLLVWVQECSRPGLLEHAVAVTRRVAGSARRAG